MSDENFKRKGPKPLPPVILNGVRYSEERDAKARGFEQPGGVVVAVEQNSGRELWLVPIYRTTYTAEESDVQDVFISQILPSGQRGLVSRFIAFEQVWPSGTIYW